VLLKIVSRRRAVHPHDALGAMGGGVSKKGSLEQARQDPNSKVAKQLFDSIDKDRSGTIDCGELCDVMEKHGESVKADWTVQEIKATIKKFDTNKDEKLNLEEARAPCTNAPAAPPAHIAGSRACMKHCCVAWQFTSALSEMTDRDMSRAKKKKKPKRGVRLGRSRARGRIAHAGALQGRCELSRGAACRN